MKLDLGIHIAMHSVLSLKPGVTQGPLQNNRTTPKAIQTTTQDVGYYTPAA
jgi:hypothetical protein